MVSAKNAAPVEKFRKDYAPLPYSIPAVDLSFDLREDHAVVTAVLSLVPRSVPLPAVFLNGREDVRLEHVAFGGRTLEAGQDYEVNGEGLTLSAEALAAASEPGQAVPLEMRVRIEPQHNSLLEGLYKSGGMFCTQCEAEGFRGIAFFPDRPDVMAVYSTRIEADKALYPVLLSNGNLVESGQGGEGRHWALWRDPFPKPCYLFALVAGDLALREAPFVTSSGRRVALKFYTAHRDIERVDFAVACLQRAMKWDEDTYGLEYDLDVFHVVAVDDFNMGAMENKSLNLFNAKLVLCRPEEATDVDHARVEAVVGHEYFHNWTGNRVTCRDWFQLTLKEGLTVYREQEFGADMGSRAVQRIGDVVRMRSAQFPEDAGPMAHPVRPESYVKMDNFYTATVYEKGSEVVRMCETLLGKPGFRKGMDLYFDRHDGCAVTCDDFVDAMADANGADLSALKVWYGQAGTPKVTLSQEYDAVEKRVTVTLTQSLRPSKASPSPRPALVPVRLALLDGASGRVVPLSSGQKRLGSETVLRLTDPQQSWTFDGVERPVVPSALRDFSAPVRFSVVGQSVEDLALLLEHDTDAFNRWDAGQTLAKQAVLGVYDEIRAAEGSAERALATSRALEGESMSLVHALSTGLRAVLADGALDLEFKAQCLALPSAAELRAERPEVDPAAMHAAGRAVSCALGRLLRAELEEALARADAAVPPRSDFAFSREQVGQRALRGTALAYLAALRREDADDGEAFALELSARAEDATNMTDELAALTALEKTGQVAAWDKALDAFARKWADCPLVMLKWFDLKSRAEVEGNAVRVKACMEHSSFVASTPNCCYSLFLPFSRTAANFHAADGSGYAFMGDAVLAIDKINRQVASRMVSSFNCYRDYEPKRCALMRAQIERIAGQPGVSPNVLEIVTKALED